MTDQQSPSEALRGHWMEPFGEVTSLVCHCGGWQWDGFGDSPTILFTDPLVQQSWWAHAADVVVRAARSSEPPASPARTDAIMVPTSLLRTEYTILNGYAASSAPHEVHWVDPGRDEPPETGYWECICRQTFAPDGVDEYAKHLAASPAPASPDEPSVHRTEWAVLSDDGEVYEVEGRTRAKAEYEARLLREGGEPGATIIERRICEWVQPFGGLRREARAASASVPPGLELAATRVVEAYQQAIPFSLVSEETDLHGAVAGLETVLRAAAKTPEARS